MNNKEKLKERLKMLYPNENLTDYDLEQMAYYFVNVFTVGSKMAYFYKKDLEK